VPTLETIAETIHADLEARTAARDRALTNARQLVRACAHAIRAVHRDDHAQAAERLAAARALADELRTDLAAFPELYYAGYTQDALKEFAEASIVHALTNGGEIPAPADLGIPSSAYIRGLAETVGELRRRVLDLLRHGYSPEIERLLGLMDDIYAVLVTMDYPDAVTHGLRRLTDIARSLLERTRGDVTLGLRQQVLEDALHRLEERLGSSDENAD